VYPRVSSRRLLIGGIAAFALALGLYLFYALTHSADYTQDTVDLKVYIDGGRIARHAYPYDGKSPYPLYDWIGWGGGPLHLPFTYTPFAAVSFVVASFVPSKMASDISVGVNVIAFVAALWFTVGGLGYRDRKVRIGATLLVAGLTLWTQPVLRTMYLGQVNLVLTALIIWDLCQPKGRWWKGIGTGVAAGIKLTPLVFTPYLLLARRFREAIGTVIGFAITVLIGFVVLPKDSVDWWFNGVFAQGKRAGFYGWAGNQSLNGLITRLSGSIAAGAHIYLVSAAIALILGVTAAAVLDRAGHPMAAIMTAALSALLASPISWDHHWVWIAPGIAVLGHYAVRWWQTARAQAIACLAVAAGILVAFAPWPARWFISEKYLGDFSLGLLWLQPNTNPAQYIQHGDKPWYYEYHWHGLHLLTGNAYILTGMALFVGLLLISLRIWTSQRGKPASVSSEEAACVPAPHSAQTT